MAQKSGIEWTESTWNPVTGCDKISPGCANCYAERMAKRLQAMGQPNYTDGFKVTMHEHVLETPLTWKKPQMVFVNSMSDLFHRDVPLEFIQKVFSVMRRASWHTFQVLTKRAETLSELAINLEWPDNVWMGVSVETAEYLHRLDHLRTVHAKVRFISFEPLLGPVGWFDLSGIDWCIVGGESGPGARPMSKAWVTEIRDQCQAAGVPFFFKQWGGTNKKKTGRQLENRMWSELPYHSASHSLRESIKKDIMHRQCITVSSMVNSHEGQDKI
ncbi:phage Gp37/Gp68 family protein [bacterium]|nr:phage Gp37/Gp68 family protein [candidate division CSSED10-310 bacterium]